MRLEENYIVINNACWLQLKYMHVMQSKFLKTTPNFFFTGAQAQCLDPGSAFVVNINLDTIYL